MTPTTQDTNDRESGGDYPSYLDHGGSLGRNTQTPDACIQGCDTTVGVDRRFCDDHDPDFGKLSGEASFGQRHPCTKNGCTLHAEYDDEPFCFKHSPDRGSSVTGYSYRRRGSTIATASGVVIAQTRHIDITT